MAFRFRGDLGVAPKPSFRFQPEANEIMTAIQTSRRSKLRRSRRALTLIELVVVIAILVALSGLIIPMVQGLGFQTNAATNATVVDDVNRAMGIFATRNDALPDSWDSLLNESGSIFTKVHSSLQLASPALVQPIALSSQQLESLNLSKIYEVYDAVEGSSDAPNLNAKRRALVSGGKLLALTMKPEVVGEPRRTELDASFRFHQYQDGDSNNEFVVLGLGQWSTIQGSAAMQVPLIQSADPTNNYARVCCVFMIPSSTASTSFPARYVGCFLPDGTTARDNMSKYNNSDN